MSAQKTLNCHYEFLPLEELFWLILVLIVRLLETHGVSVSVLVLWVFSWIWQTESETINQTETLINYESKQLLKHHQGNQNNFRKLKNTFFN